MNLARIILLLVISTLLAMPSHAATSLSTLNSQPLTIERPNLSDPGDICMLTLEHPEAPSDHIALKGNITNASTGIARLTMWVTFPDGGRYFSYLDFAGGSSAKPFQLPMHSPG